MKNQIELDFANNDDLASIFQGKRTGDKVEIKVCFQVTEVGQNGAKGAIEKVYIEDDDEKEARPEDDKPIAVMVSLKDAVPKVSEKDEY